MIHIAEKKLLFTDLDNTLITTVSGKMFPKGIWDLQFKWDVLKCIKWLVHKQNIFEIVIVSNQGGIPRYISEESFVCKLRYITQSMVDFINPPVPISLQETGLWVYGLYASKEDGCPKSWRKPECGMLDYFYEEVSRTVNKQQCLMIGDASEKPRDFDDSDYQCAKNFGCDYLDVREFVSLYLPEYESSMPYENY